MLVHVEIHFRNAMIHYIYITDITVILLWYTKALLVKDSIQLNKII